jgi:hypothetical protein
MKKIQMPASPEGAIRTRARKLPIGSCYINDDWQESKFATVFVTRNHVNRNITFGCFEVDLLCLGLKDCFYKFNFSRLDFEELLKNDHITCIPIDYTLAHNIVYSAIDFASAFGFQPHKSFNVAKYVLEEDDDNIELIDIECGEDEMPVVFSSPDEPNHHIIRKLEETAGPGNFMIHHVDRDGNLIEGNDPEEDTDDPEKLFGDDDIDSWTPDDYNAFFKGERKASMQTERTLVNVFYRVSFPDESLEESEKTPQCKEIDNLELADFPEERNHFKSDDEFEIFNDFSAKVFDGENSITDKKCKSLIIKYPHNMLFYFLWHVACLFRQEIKNARSVIEEAVLKFPDEILIMTLYANMVLEDKDIESFEKHFKGRYFIKDFAPNQTTYSYQQVVDFYSVIAWYYILKSDTQRADQYMYAIDHLAENAHDYTLWKKASSAIISYKAKRLQRETEKGFQVYP